MERAPLGRHMGVCLRGCDAPPARIECEALDCVAVAAISISFVLQLEIAVSFILNFVRAGLGPCCNKVLYREAIFAHRALSVVRYTLHIVRLVQNQRRDTTQWCTRVPGSRITIAR